jgi:uncharacterized RDD family membrane protein YckC
MLKISNLEGVYYRRDDYAGVWRRLLIEVIDTIVAIAISVGVSVLLLAFLPEDLLGWTILSAWIIIWFVYFVILKRTRFRTLGYIIGGVRIVNLQGDNPGLTPLSIRLIFAILGPFNTLIDLFWIPGDGRRQALRDKFANTYVIRKDALPAGQGRVVYARYSIMAWNFLFQEVREFEA